MKKHAAFIIFFAVTMLVFLWKLFFMKAGFLYGDYADQFYPWSLIYSDSLKGFSFPFWTRYFHSGFPLMAEGQVGGFYLANIFFFFLLPFRIAYNYIVLFHFALAGIFTYLYTRKLGADQWGGALSALTFCFGSAYAGCFYNTVTMKTLIWVPLVLFLFEKYFDLRKSKYLLISGVILGIQFLAGFAQMAAYSVLFYMAYFLYGLWRSGRADAKDAGRIILGTAIAVLIAFPQMILSWDLIRLSGRADAGIGFALWGSFAPLNVMAAVLPSWVFRGTRLYVGIFGLLFAIIGILSIRGNKRLRPLLLVLFLSVFLALGKYNPVYVLCLRFTQFYGLRNPSKFLFFGMFAAAVFSGIGFSSFFSGRNEEIRRKGVKIFLSLVGIVLFIFAAIKIILRYFGNEILELGKWYATKFVYGKAFHRYDLDTYTAKVEAIYRTLIQKSSITEPFLMFSLLTCVVVFIFCLQSRRKSHLPNIQKYLVMGILFLDLYAFSFYGTGFKGNIKDFDVLKPDLPKLYSKVSKDDSVFRILPYDVASGKLPNWAKPNMNAVYGMDSIGAYSPLAVSRYAQKLSGLEVVDQSLGLIKPAEGSIGDYKDIIKALNVKYVISSQKLKVGFLKEKGEEEGVYLYKLKGALPRGFVVRDLKGPLKILNKKVRIVEYRSGYASFLVDAPESGFFVFSEFYYPGWKAFVDGKEMKIIQVRNIIQAVEVKKGSHEVVFRFEPEFLRVKR